MLRLWVAIWLFVQTVAILLSSAGGVTAAIIVRTLDDGGTSAAGGEGERNSTFPEDGRSRWWKFEKRGMPGMDCLGGMGAMRVSPSEGPSGQAAVSTLGCELPSALVTRLVPIDRFFLPEPPVFDLLRIPRSTPAG